MEEFKHSLTYIRKSLYNSVYIFEENKNATRMSMVSHKYFDANCLLSVIDSCYQGDSFEVFIEDFLDSYTTGESAVREKFSFHAGFYSCSNSSKIIVQGLLGEKNASIYKPHKYGEEDNTRQYIIHKHEILEIERKYIDRNPALMRFGNNDIIKSAKHVLLLTIEAEKFFNFVYDFFKNNTEGSLKNAIINEPKMFTLLIDKNFSEKDDSKSLCRRVLKHLYQTEETMKSLNVKMVNKTYIYKNALSEMIYESLTPQRREQIIEDIVCQVL